MDKKYYEIIEDGIITAIGKSKSVPSTAVEITEEKYDELFKTICGEHGEDTLETRYLLSAETEHYEPYDTTDEEKIDWYAHAVMANEMVEEDVPAQYQVGVESIISLSRKVTA